MPPLSPMPPPHSPLSLFRSALLCILVFGIPIRGVEPQERTAARTVAVGDAHGDSEQLTRVLREAGLVDERSRWTGGDAGLVLTGDMIDRGSRSREVLDLIMRLQREALGQVHPLLGNHEVMNLMADLRYVSAEEYPTWAGSGSRALREERWRSWMAYGRTRAARLGFPEPPYDEQARHVWMESHPAGFFERRRALGPDGVYGRWLRGLEAARLQDGVAFVHGGLAPGLPFASLDVLNAEVQREIAELDRLWASLSEVGLLWEDLTWGEALTLLKVELTVWEAVDSLPSDRVDPEALRGRPSDETLGEVRRLLDWQAWTVNDPEGPLWYRGLALDPEASAAPVPEDSLAGPPEGSLAVQPEDSLAAQVEEILERYGAQHLVVGHTVTDDGRIHARFGGDVFAIDTGISSAVAGRAAALEILDGRFTALYPGEEPVELWAPKGDGAAERERKEPARGQESPAESEQSPAESEAPPDSPEALLGLSLDRVEDFLRKAAVSEVRKLQTGITKPSRATLDDGTLRHDAAIQSVNRCEDVRGKARRRERECDSYRYNLAAYEIGKLLGLRSIPPCVEREYDGQAAAFTWWIDGAMTFADMKARHASPPDGGAWNRQQFVVGVFDELIYNTDRNQSNLLVDPAWRIWMIDHTRAFRVVSGLRNPGMLAKLRIEPELLSRLRGLDSEALEGCCGDWLTTSERKAVLARRDRIVARFQ